MFGVLKQKRLLGDAFWALSGQVMSALALLLGTRVMTELVTPDIFGQVALLNGFVALGVAVFSYPFICAGMRLIPECRNQRERGALHRTVFNLTAKSTATAMALLMLGGGIYCYWAGAEFGLFALTGLLLAVTVRRELGIQLLIGERKQRGASFWQTTDSVLRPLLAIGLVWGGGQNPGAVLLGYIFASVASNTLWSIVHGGETGSHHLNQALVAAQFKRQVWAYALPLIPMELIFWINGLGDRYVIGYMLTAAEVGLYAASYTIINEAFNRSAMVLLRTFQPAYFQCFAEANTKEAFSVLKLWLASVFGVGVLGVVLVMLCKDWVAALLLAESYQASVVLMPAIAVGAALSALGTVLAQPLLAKKRTQSVLKGRICGALAAAISLPLLVGHYGLAGAAIANPLYFGIEALVLALLAKPWRKAPGYSHRGIGLPEQSLVPAVLHPDP
ncbi:lipopolysaccharide biosynthesis protein [Methylomonas sp. LL1]|uniref:lipopolysaccharide biosynthesis protein n=1 Tax=Methylomonas sp. LL1 TaxID=2785785 RepID=UPI0018C43F0A|nr:lipopolysaccharide biosynthesis protein [Methylomonas sp. LL1]QPK65041.1 lipopolysaccharide biosynthesis protein [Methylomonas sp. LL1]